MWRRLLVCLTVAAGLTPSYAANSGMITVTVVDQQGSPVQGAIVTMHQSDGGAGTRLVPECITDETGTCSQINFPMGTYLISANRTSDGYPNLAFEFYSHQNHPQHGYQSKPLVVELTPDRPAASITFTLGPKAAFFKLEVIDETTGEPITNYTITLRSATDPEDYISIGEAAGSTVLLPPDEDVQVEISAPGYGVWHLSEHKELNSGKPLHLHPQETRELEIRMKHP